MARYISFRGGNSEEMNTRHRSGNGYRSNVIPSRISPETSTRSHPNLYHSDNRNFNRPFGRIHPKSSLPVHHQVSRRGNLFVEAGRLAVDYLISHGLLPPDVLSTSSTSGTLKINNNLNSNPRPKEVAEDLSSPTVGHSMAPTCSDNSLSADDASETRRSSPILVKEKGSLLKPFCGNDLTNENGRDGSLPDKANPSSDIIIGCDGVPTQQDAKEVDTNIANSIDNSACTNQSQDEKSFNYEKNLGSGLHDFTQRIDRLSSIHVELEKESNMSDLGEVDTGKNSSVNYCEDEANNSRKDCNDLLNLCNSTELPTKSSSKFGSADTLLLMAEGSNDNCQSGSASQFLVHVKKNSIGCSSGSSEICGPMDKGRGKKRTLGNEDAIENPKKAKEWLTVSQSDEDLQLSDSENKHIGSQELIPSCERVEIQTVNQESDTCVSMLPKGGAGPSVAYSEEKQLFPGSFKICDLNLMEGSDANENHDDPTILYSSNPVPKKEMSVDVDLSMNNSCSLSNVYSRNEAPNKGVEIIDLESYPLQGDKGFHGPARRMQSEFTGLESFPNHLQNSSENPDVQDGYGLMLSELIGTDIQNCPSGQPEINSLHNDIGLHHGEGILSDYDQIYMSLGEIPISLLPSWDQPTQDYEKPF